MMARVRGVTAASTAAGSRQSVASSTSTKTGRAPARTITLAVAGQVSGVVMTSSPSPSPTPSARSARYIAAVQDETASACGPRRSRRTRSRAAARTARWSASRSRASAARSRAPRRRGRAARSRAGARRARARPPAMAGRSTGTAMARRIGAWAYSGQPVDHELAAPGHDGDVAADGDRRRRRPRRPASRSATSLPERVA